MVNLRSYLKVIESYLEQNQNDQAIVHSLNILKTYPNLVDALRLLGQAYLENKKYPEATDCFEKVISIVPDDFVSHVAFSSIKEEERDLDAAIFHMELAFDSQPSNNIVQQEIKRLIGKRDGTPPEKINLSRGALVRMYAKGELYQQAINEINAALSLNPQRIDLKVLLAEMLVKSNSPVQAAELCNQIVEMLPFCLVPNQILYQIYLENGLSENSKSVLDRLISINPYYSWIVPLSTSVEDVPDEKIEIEKIEYTSAFSTSNFETFDGSVQDKVFDAVPSDGSVDENPPAIASEFINEIHIPNGPFTTNHSFLESDQAGVNSLSPDNVPDNQLPEFMKEAGWQKSNNPDVDPPMDYYESSLTEAQESELPEWLKVKASEEFIVNSSVSNALNEMVSESNDPVIFEAPILEEGNFSGQSKENQPSNSEVTMSDDNSPAIDPKDENSDWMAQFFDEAKNNQQEPDSEKDLPDWLNNLGQEETDTKPEESLPEWLNTLDADNEDKKDDTQKSSVDLDSILSDLANQPQEDISIPNNVSNEEQSDIPSLDAEDLSLRLENLTQLKPAFATTEVERLFIPESTLEQHDTQTKDQDDYLSQVSPIDEDESQIPDWVKTVLTGPDIPDLVSNDAESLTKKAEDLIYDSSSSSPEKEVESDEYSDGEGAISASTSEELLGWLRDISPEQGIAGEGDVIDELTQNEIESPVAEPVDEAIDRLTDSTLDTVSVDFPDDTPSDISTEETTSASIPLEEYIEEIEPVSTTLIADEAPSDLIPSTVSQSESPDGLISETMDASEPVPQELTPESPEIVPDEIEQLVDLIKNDQFEDAIHHPLLSSQSENDQARILEVLQELKPERESNFAFMQFLGDVFAKSNRFDEAFAAYNRAEELLTQNQE